MTPQPPPSSPRLPSSLPIVALVFSVLGFCFPPLLLVGIIIGIVALVQNKGSLAAGIIAVVLPVAAIPVIGILAAIAIPNFIKFQARSKQSECKTYLKSAFTAEKSYFMEKDGYDVHPEKVGFVADRNRYLYVFSGTGHPGEDGTSIAAALSPQSSNQALYDGIPADVRESLGTHGKCPECSITIACAGNIDNDPEIDVWSISTEDRPGAPAGTARHDFDDVTGRAGDGF